MITSSIWLVWASKTENKTSFYPEMFKYKTNKMYVWSDLNYAFILFCKSSDFHIIVCLYFFTLKKKDQMELPYASSGVCFVYMEHQTGGVYRTGVCLLSCCSDSPQAHKQLVYSECWMFAVNWVSLNFYHESGVSNITSRSAAAVAAAAGGVCFPLQYVPQH